MQPPDSPPTTGADVTDIALASVRFKAGHSGNTISHGSSTGAMNLEHAVPSVSIAAEPLTPSASANVTSPIREGEPEAEEGAVREMPVHPDHRRARVCEWLPLPRGCGGHRGPRSEGLPGQDRPTNRCQQLIPRNRLLVLPLLFVILDTVQAKRLF